MRRHSAFTLVEILIVVVILGILAAIVIPTFTRATSDAQANATLTDLVKMRRAIGVYRARNNGQMPPIVEADGDPAVQWGPLVGQSGEYMQGPPVNAWVGGDNARKVAVMENYEPAADFQTDYGWIFDPVTGELYAASFDATDKPLPRN